MLIDKAVKIVTFYFHQAYCSIDKSKSEIFLTMTAIISGNEKSCCTKMVSVATKGILYEI